MLKLKKQINLKSHFNKLKNHPKYDSVVNWTKLISITGSTQIIIQVVGFISGILIIHLLSVQEYAFYTLANTMLGTMTVLADGGITTGVMAQGGKVWQDREKMGSVLATGLNLRKKFAIVSLLISLPILFYLLRHTGSSLLTAVLISLALIITFYAALSDSILEIVPKLHQNILPLQKNQLSVGIGRLLLTSFFVFIFPWAFFAVLATGIPRIWGNIQLQKIGNKLVDKELKPDTLVQKEILKVVKRKMPESIYFCLSGQINIWLISIFGTTAALATLGALGRFNMITNLFLVIFSTLVVPRFARLQSSKKEIRKKIIRIIVILFILSFVIIVTASFFSNQFLWILGKSYKGLNKVFILIIAGGCISMFQGVFFAMNSAKGWIISPVLFIIVSFTTTIVALSLVDVASLEGVIIFTMIVSTVQGITLIGYCFNKISKM